MYAYHPSDDTVKSVDECLESGKVQDVWKIMNANDIIDGIDELGVLIYGHDKNAYWFGSQLSIGETKKKIAGSERNSTSGDFRYDCRNEMGNVESNKRVCLNREHGLQRMLENSIDIHWGLHRTLYKLDTLVRQGKC